MSLLIRHDGAIELQDHWPGRDDQGRLVILPGGEAGILTAWWHAPDQSEWRWQLDLSNQTRQAPLELGRSRRKVEWPALGNSGATWHDVAGDQQTLHGTAPAGPGAVAPGP